MGALWTGASATFGCACAIAARSAERCSASEEDGLDDAACTSCPPGAGAGRGPWSSRGVFVANPRGAAGAAGRGAVSDALGRDPYALFSRSFFSFGGG